MPQLNTTSTADISFMLLIFFLVTTSMDTDKGVTRLLPPVDDTSDNAPTDVARDKVLQLRVNADNTLTADGRNIDYGILSRHVETFVAKAGSSHLITIATSADAGYDAYFKVQSGIVAAYKSLRDKEARRRWHKPMAQCSPEQQKAVIEACPQHVAEDYASAQAGTNSGRRPAADTYGNNRKEAAK